jgi:predicted nucleic acid-binding protein
VILVDTSLVVTFMNRRDDDHERVAGWMDTVREAAFTLLPADA